MPSSPAVETVSDLLQAYDPHGDLHGEVQVREIATGGNCAAFLSLLRHAKKHLGGPLTRERFKALIARVSKAHRMSYVRVLRLSLADFCDRLLVSARDAAKLRLTQASSATAVKPAVNKPKRTRCPTKYRKPRPLTVRQTEVVQIVGECTGNIAKAARQLGRDRKTVEETYRAGLAKLGKTVYHSRDKTRLLPRDKRGQEAVSEDDDLRR